jgi:hypothetical protein
MSARYTLQKHPAFQRPAVQGGSLHARRPWFLARGEMCMDEATGHMHTVGELVSGMRPPLPAAARRGSRGLCIVRSALTRSFPMNRWQTKKKRMIEEELEEAAAPEEDEDDDFDYSSSGERILRPCASLLAGLHEGADPRACCSRLQADCCL